VLAGWIGRGYGHRTPAGEEAAALAQERDGLRLDPVYTAKAVAALRAENAAGRFGAGPVLYVHTDGPRPRY
jgi:D-cysteine desulfhydrase